MSNLSNYINTGSSNTFKNVLINGGFDVWQRGTYQTNEHPYMSSDDRWINSQSSGILKTHEKVLSTHNEFTYFSRTVCQGGTQDAGHYCDKIQKIEDVNTLAGKTATVSFWAKADSSKNVSISFNQYFGAGGSPYSGYFGGTKFNLTTTWTKFTAAIDILSIAGKTIGPSNALYFGIWFSAGSTYDSATDSLGAQTGTFDIANVQIEEGFKATNFEKRNISMEEHLCYRYYYRIVGSRYAENYSGASGLNTWTKIDFDFPTTMRVDPNVTLLSSTNFDDSTQNPNTYIKTDGGTHFGMVRNTIAGGISAHNFEFDAEM